MITHGKIVGIENFGWKDKKTGDARNSTRYHFQYMDKQRVAGIGCGTVFAGDGLRLRAAGEEIAVMWVNGRYMQVDSE